MSVLEGCEGQACRAGPHRRPAPRGFTLLEVMISGGLLLIGLSASLGLVTSLTELKEHQRHMTQVMAIAEATIEELLLAPSTDDDLLAGDHGPRYFDSMGLEASFGMYEAKWKVTGAKPIAGIRQVDVTVRWMEGRRVKTYVITTWRL